MHKTTGFVLVLKRMTRDINCVNKKKKKDKKENNKWKDSFQYLKKRHKYFFIP